MNAWEKNVRKVTPYTPGEQPKVDDVIKLNTNECPFIHHHLKLWKHWKT